MVAKNDLPQQSVHDLIPGLTNGAHVALKSPISYTRLYPNQRHTDVRSGVKDLYDLALAHDGKQVVLGAHSRIIRDAVESFGAYKEFASGENPRGRLATALGLYLQNLCGGLQGAPPTGLKGLCSAGNVIPNNPLAWIDNPGLKKLRSDKMKNGALVGVYIAKGTLKLYEHAQGGEAITTDVYYMLGRLTSGAANGLDRVQIYK